MKRFSLLLVLLVLAALGCNLTGANAPDPTATPIVLNPPVSLTETESEGEPASTIQATVESVPVVLAEPASRQDTGGTSVTDNTSSTSDVIQDGDVFHITCSPRTDWPLYTINAGDNLTKIATRTGSTLAALVQANCLDNPNLLEVNQQIRVPTLPVYQGVAGAVQLVNEPATSPHVYNAAPATLITLSWAEVTRSGADRVVFYADFTIPVQRSLEIGTDGNLSDGAQIPWMLDNTPEAIAVIRAAAYNGSQLVQETQHVMTLNIGYNILMDAGYVEVSPAAQAGRNRYQLTPGSTVTLSWAAANTEAQYVEFWLYPDQGDPTRQILGVDNNISDGASFAWTVPPGISGGLWAQAVLAGPRYQSPMTGPSVFAERLPTPQPQPSIVGQVVVSPGTLNGGWYEVAQGATVTLTWPEAPTDVARVHFYITPTGTGTADAKSILGTDDNLSNGASLTLDTNYRSLYGHLHAEAQTSGGWVTVTSDTVNIVQQ